MLGVEAGSLVTHTLSPTPRRPSAHPDPGSAQAFSTPRVMSPPPPAPRRSPKTSLPRTGRILDVETVSRVVKQCCRGIFEYNLIQAFPEHHSTYQAVQPSSLIGFFHRSILHWSQTTHVLVDQCLPRTCPFTASPHSSPKPQSTTNLLSVCRFVFSGHLL